MGFAAVINQRMWCNLGTMNFVFKAIFIFNHGSLGCLIAIGKWFDQLCNWKTPLTRIMICIFYRLLLSSLANYYKSIGTQPFAYI
ncbi:hypothetical protein Hanom_Chr07g00596581 [Helianthus anomalus]